MIETILSVGVGVVALVLWIRYGSRLFEEKPQRFIFDDVAEKSKHKEL